MSRRHRLIRAKRRMGASARTLIAIAVVCVLYLVVLSRGQIFFGRLW